MHPGLNLLRFASGFRQKVSVFLRFSYDFSSRLEGKLTILKFWQTDEATVTTFSLVPTALFPGFASDKRPGDVYKLKNGEDTPGKLSRGVPRHRDLQTQFKTKVVHVAYDPDLSRFAHSKFITNIMELDFQVEINLLVPHMKTTHRQNLTLSKAFCSERHPV